MRAATDPEGLDVSSGAGALRHGRDETVRGRLLACLLNRLVTRALAEAAAVPSRLPGRRALITILFRSDIVLDDLGAQAAGHLLLTTYFAARLATAGAHADQYGVFPVGVLDALSLDLVDSLQERLRSLPLPYPSDIWTL